MLTLQIQNLGVAPIAFKDPQGYTEFSAEVAAVTTSTFAVSADLLDRLYTQLQGLETPVLASDGTTILAGIRWNVLASTADARVSPEGSSGLPVVNGVNVTAIDVSSGNDATLSGAALITGQVKATALIGTTALGFTATAVVPGSAGNDIAVVVNACPVTGEAIVVGVVGSVITITPVHDGSTAAAIIAAVNADSVAKYLVLLSDGHGTFTAAGIAHKHLATGAGPGVSVSANGTSCPIYATSPTAVSCTIPTTVATAGHVVSLDYRNGNHVSRLSLPVVA